MHILRRAALVALAAVLPFILFLLAFDYWVINTASHPTAIKKIVADSGIYATFTQSALEQANAKAGGKDVVSLLDPAVKTAAQQALSPQFLQQSTENIIDGTYHWLDGRVAQPDFKIDLSSKKTDIATLVADHARQAAAQLPICARGIPTPDINTFDVFNASCLPRGVTPDQIAAQVKDELLKNQEFLKEPVITADKLKDSQTGQSVFEKENIKQVPDYYQLAKKTPIILAVLAILILAGIVFLSPTRSKGLRRVGIVLLVIGVLMMVFSYWLRQADIQNRIMLDSKNGINNEQIVKSLRSVVKDLASLVGNNYWFFGGLYTVLGVSSLAYAYYFSRHTPKSVKPSKPSKI
ncbi:hypothetical protein KW794_02385 [Candidatus Saccharibacteria bacterium]|nr:hypothetical protein [Candidatus Saccharibacteria bacterium]